MRTSRRFLIPIPAILAVAVGTSIAVFRRPSSGPAPAATVPQRPVVASLRAEPRSFNRLVAGDRSSAVLALLMHARLVQLNHKTQEIEPALATRWTLDPDGRTYTLELRQGVVFSDGAPFTADDVVFTFQALYDPKVEGPLTSGLKINGQPIAVRKTGDHTVVLTLPAPYGPGLRLLNALPILPAHKLRDALARGELAKAWTAATPPSELAGLGPGTCCSPTPPATGSSWCATRATARAARTCSRASSASPSGSSRPRTPSAWRSRPASWTCSTPRPARTTSRPSGPSKPPAR